MNTREFVLDHPCGVTISRHLMQSAVAKIEGVTKREMGTGYVWYSLPESVIHGSRVLMSLCFYGHRLDSISLVVVDDALYGASWNDWSEKKEHLRTKHTEEWLRHIGFPVGSYVWGEVWAQYDPRSGSGGGGVRYRVQ